MTWALKFRTDHSFDLVPFGPEQDTLKFLQEAVGGYIERVPFNIEQFTYDMWVNEDGIALRLDTNCFGSHIYQMRTGVSYRILGDIIITGDDESEHTPGMTEEATSALVQHMTLWYLETHTEQ
jgi:hypothetical protein